MPKVEFTPELTECLRSLRIKNGITAKSLSESIGKSPSYINKIEKNQIQKIDFDVFHKLLTTVVGTNEEKLNDAYKSIVKYFKMVFSKEELQSQLWYTNYDQVQRQLPIPESLVDNINDDLIAINTTISELTSFINKNISLEDEALAVDFPFNEWAYLSNGSSFIKLKYSESTINDILQKKSKSSSYTDLLAITYHVELLKAGITTNNPKEMNECMHIAHELLKNNKIYTLSEEQEVLENSKSMEELEEALLPDEYKNKKILNEIDEQIKIISQLDVRRANMIFEKIVDNIKCDPGLILSIYAIDFKKVSEFEHQQKKEFFDKLKTFIEGYSLEESSNEEINFYE